MNTKFPSNVTREFQGVLDRDSKRVYRDGRNFRGKRIVAAVNSPFQAELFISGEGLEGKLARVRSVERNTRAETWIRFPMEYRGLWPGYTGTSNQLSACYLPAFDSFAIFCPLAHSFVPRFWGRRFLRGLL